LKASNETISKHTFDRDFLYVGKNWDWQNWDDARYECQKKGGDLASNLSKEELGDVFLSIVPENMREYGIWIGGHSSMEDSVEWVNGDPLSYTNGLWASGEPVNESPLCMFISNGPHTRKDGTQGPAFTTEQCDSPSPFLCEVK